ncbi:MAG: glycosyltransferase family 39 protein [Candidatus Niyogibacteria bacterium]|nr:glycosyltransferase family 39 protein [Candidatus Niyogibacteria bacterium]
MSKKRIILILIVILIIGGGLRFWNLSGPDMIFDDVLYAFRSIGYIDYVAATNKQSTPVSWFAEPQWWQYISFHDAPPLVFAIQWIFFKIGGQSIFVARIPFILIGLLSIFFIYLLGKQIGNAIVGLASASVLAVMNYSIWISRIGLLDGFLVLWIILSFYFFIKAQKNPQNYMWWGIMLGLGILTKYTFLFMGPVFLIALLWWQRSAWRQKWLYCGLFAALLLISPLIVYNFMMWQERGHLDAALSTLIGQHPEDFSGLTREVRRSFNIFGTAYTLVARTMSIGFQILIGFSIIGLLYATINDRGRKYIYIMLWLGIAWSLGMLALIGGSERFGVILLPFIALAIGLGGCLLCNTLQGPKRTIMAGIVIVMFLWEMLFAIQNQLIPAPFLNNALISSANRPRWAGYNQLDQYVENFYKTYSDPSYIVTFGDEPQLIHYQTKLIEKRAEKNPHVQQSHLLVYDDRMDWTPSIWVFERRRLYDSSPIHSLTQFLKTLSTKGTAFYANFGVEDVIFILTTEISRHSPVSDEWQKKVEAISADLALRVEPIDTIYSPLNEAVFTIYRVPLLPSSGKGEGAL